MSHRHLRPAWWVARLCEAAERRVSPRLTMPALAWAAWLDREAELWRLADWVRPGSVALDIGANRGVWSWHLRRLKAVVHDFEPNPALAERLRRALPGLVVHDCALSDREGETELRLPVVQGTAYDGWATVEAENRFAALAVEGERRQRVRLRTLDGFRLPRVDFVQIDVEGHELSVLRGARGTLCACRPLLLFEADDRNRPRAVADCRAWLAGIGYRMLPALSRGCGSPRRSGRSSAAQEPRGRRASERAPTLRGTGDVHDTRNCSDGLGVHTDVQPSADARQVPAERARPDHATVRDRDRG